MDNLLTDWEIAVILANPKGNYREKAIRQVLQVFHATHNTTVANNLKAYR